MMGSPTAGIFHANASQYDPADNAENDVIRRLGRQIAANIMVIRCDHVQRVGESLIEPKADVTFFPESR